MRFSPPEGRPRDQALGTQGRPGHRPLSARVLHELLLEVLLHELLGPEVKS